MSEKITEQDLNRIELMLSRKEIGEEPLAVDTLRGFSALIKEWDKLMDVYWLAKTWLPKLVARVRELEAQLKPSPNREDAK